MGVVVYWAVCALVIVLGMVMPQHGKQRIQYITAMAVLHAFVSGLRYRYLTGDMMVYERIYFISHGVSFFDEYLLSKGVNTGYYWFSKVVAVLSNGDYQVYLMVLAIIIEVAVAMLVYKYSPRPWISYLVWNCMSFYIFGFSAMKQSLAMAFVMLAMDAVLENRLRRFLLFALIAGAVHFPAFAFLPAYWIAKARIKPLTMICYVAAALVILAFQGPIVKFVTEIYYEEGEVILTDEADLGGRFFMMVVMLVMGICLKGFTDRRFEKVTNMMVVAAIFQMFSGFDNIFTRFADYYFQISILYLPVMVSSPAVDNRLGGSHSKAIFRFNRRSLDAIAVCMAVYLLWYYNRTCLSASVASVDNYLNYRSMWYGN